VSLWVVYALLSALFAALTSILAKVGVASINSNLATAIRTLVVLFVSWGIVFVSGGQRVAADITNMSGKTWAFLIFSGLATGLSWLCYYKALQIGPASKVILVDKFSLVIAMVLAFVVLKEPLSVKAIIGGALVTLGTLVLVV
jgi:transporter family protein